MPEPVKSDRRYLPGLDGLRAVAVLGVVAYHLGVDALPGGLLGVSVFFTLSGYLITDLLLGQLADGSFSFRSFWLARARRLLPALLVVLVVVAAWVTVLGPQQTDEFRTAALTAALYVNNWWLVLRDVSYFAQFDAPGPLNHLWSLAVEEQFYVLWPVLLVAGRRLVRERATGFGLRPRLGASILGLAALSAVAMALLHEPGTDPSRVYYGTDTRAAELLIGAALATMWPSQRLRAEVTAGARTAIDVAGVAGFAVIGAMFTGAEEFDTFLYEGGFVLLAVGVSVAVASIVHPASRLAPIVGCRPMTWIGARSYGIYLWHFPIIVLTTPTGQTPGLARGALQVAATLGVSALSWRFIEDPIRHGAIGRLVERVRSGDRPTLGGSPARVAGAGVVAVVLVAALAGFSGVRTVESDTDDELAISETVSAEPRAAAASPAVAAGTGGAADPASLGPCTSVVHVGGSTSLGLISDNYIPDPDEQISARYAEHGVATQHYEIAGGRAIIESYRENPHARDSAQKWRDQGYRGCWVFALGTMDAANVGIGAPTPMTERIDAMMAIADGDPVLWVNVKTIAETGSWRAEVMPPWNEALREACGRWDNLRVYDWASDVRDEWYSEDGIHQDGPGYVERADHIARALATAFPAAASTSTPTAGAGCEFDL